MLSQDNKYMSNLCRNVKLYNPTTKNNGEEGEKEEKGKKEEKDKLRREAISNLICQNFIQWVSAFAYKRGYPWESIVRRYVLRILYECSTDACAPWFQYLFTLNIWDEGEVHILCIWKHSDVRKNISKHRMSFELFRIQFALEIIKNYGGCVETMKHLNAFTKLPNNNLNTLISLNKLIEGVKIGTVRMNREGVVIEPTAEEEKEEDKKNINTSNSYKLLLDNLAQFDQLTFTQLFWICFESKDTNLFKALLIVGTINTPLLDNAIDDVFMGYCRRLDTDLPELLLSRVSNSTLSDGLHSAINCNNIIAVHNIIAKMSPELLASSLSQDVWFVSILQLIIDYTLNRAIEKKNIIHKDIRKMITRIYDSFCPVDQIVTRDKSDEFVLKIFIIVTALYQRVQDTNNTTTTPYVNIFVELIHLCISLRKDDIKWLDNSDSDISKVVFFLLDQLLPHHLEFLFVTSCKELWPSFVLHILSHDVFVSCTDEVKTRVVNNGFVKIDYTHYRQSATCDKIWELYKIVLTSRHACLITDPSFTIVLKRITTLSFLNNDVLFLFVGPNSGMSNTVLQTLYDDRSLSDNLPLFKYVCKTRPGAINICANNHYIFLDAISSNKRALADYLTTLNREGYMTIENPNKTDMYSPRYCAVIQKTPGAPGIPATPGIFLSSCCNRPVCNKSTIKCTCPREPLTLNEVNYWCDNSEITPKTPLSLKDKEALRANSFG